MLHSGSDYFLEAVDSWSRVGFVVARPADPGEAGRPPSGPSRPLTWPSPCSALGYSPGKWVPAIFVILGCLVDFWVDVEVFRCFQLNQGLILDLEALECVTLPLIRSQDRVSGGARPAGLGDAARPGILPNSA